MTEVKGISSTDWVDWSVDPGTDEVVVPDVVGWRVLVMPFEAKKKSDGGVFIPETVQEKEELVITVAKVIQVGPLAYKAEHMKDKNGEQHPWCKEGDVVIIGKYAGMKFKFRGINLRILNDDEIIAVVPKED